jgi:predicted metal-dependent hydrolase
MTRQRLRRENHPEPDCEEKADCIRRAREYLPERVSFYSSLMGLQPAGITITGARTRFGSCSSKKRLSFSWRLMQYPDKAIDYVVVHELAHLRYMNHSKEFYELIEKFMPDYKQRRKLLKE